MNDDYELLKEHVHLVLVEHGIVKRHETVSLLPCYKALTKDREHTHYLIVYDNQCFFLKSKKREDCASHCNSYLREFKNDDGSYAYPIILVPEFAINNQLYYITSYTIGENIETLSSRLSFEELERISLGVLRRMEELSSIQSAFYSVNNEFVADSYTDIMVKKLEHRFDHPVFHGLSMGTLSKALRSCYRILQESTYSLPTLIHMDIKPKNIIWNRNTQNVYLVDFELSRFGDVDYGWTQILVSSFNQLTKEYRYNIIPKMLNSCPLLKETEKSPKLQIYILYQTACNMIYYHDRRLPQSQENAGIFHKTLIDLAIG